MKIKAIDNKELANQIRQQIKNNDGYCISNPTKNEDTKCMCKEFLEQGVGECHCGLYIKTEV